MKRMLSMLLSLMMLLCCALPTAVLAETATQAKLSPKEAELAQVATWLTQGRSEEEILQMLSWDRETILQKLDGYDQPLEYNTKEEIADQLLMVTDMFGIFADLGQKIESGEDPTKALSDAMENSKGNSAAEGLLGLLGGVMSSMTSGMMGGMYDGVDWSIDEDWDDGSYYIEESFNGTYWQSGDTKLEAVWEDGKYMVVITGGEKPLFYLCELGEYVAEDTFYPRLTSTGTGDPQTDASQPDHGQGAFVYDWKNDQIIWHQANGNQMTFDHIIDPLNDSQWFGSGKSLRIIWLGENNYELIIEQGFTTWDYLCVLEEDSDTLTGSGVKTSYGTETNLENLASFAFQDARRQLIWTDEAEPEAAQGLTFEAVARHYIDGLWQNDAYTLLISWIPGSPYYDFHVLEDTDEAPDENGEVDVTHHDYVCTYDWHASTFTSVDASTVEYDPSYYYLDPTQYTGSATFTLQEDDVMVWLDASGMTGEGVILKHEVF